LIALVPDVLRILSTSDRRRGVFSLDRLSIRFRYRICSVYVAVAAVVSESDCGARGPRFESLTASGCVHRDGHCDMQPWARAAPCCSADINSALRPFGVARSSTSFGWGKGGNVTCAGWQIALCDTIWHVRSSSGEAGLLAKGESLYRIHLGLLYLLTYCNYFVRQRLLSVHATRDLAFIVCLLWR